MIDTEVQDSAVFTTEELEAEAALSDTGNITETESSSGDRSLQDTEGYNVVVPFSRDGTSGVLSPGMLARKNSFHVREDEVKGTQPTHAAPLAEENARPQGAQTQALTRERAVPREGQVRARQRGRGLCCSFPAFGDWSTVG